MCPTSCGQEIIRAIRIDKKRGVVGKLMAMTKAVYGIWLQRYAKVFGDQVFKDIISRVAIRCRESDHALSMVYFFFFCRAAL